MWGSAGGDRGREVRRDLRGAMIRRNEFVTVTFSISSVKHVIQVFGINRMYTSYCVQRWLFDENLMKTQGLPQFLA